MAFSEIYVDPSIAADSGAGTVGDPYGDLQYAIEQTTFDTTNGTRVNIKAGTDEILAEPISTSMADTGTTIAWAATRTAPCIFQGYTTTAADGGVGGISGGGTVSIFDNANFDWIYFIDLHLHNTGIQRLLRFDNDSAVLRCEINNGTNAIIMGDDCIIMGCHIHDSTIGMQTENECFVGYNFIENDGTRTMLQGINLANTGSVAYRNIIKVDSTSDGITMADKTVAIQNSIWSDAGTGQGIVPSTTTRSIQVVMNNIVEGFSGTGGVGFDFSPAGTYIQVYSGNSAYDNATEYNAPAAHTIFDDFGTNETLSASAFTDATNKDFSPVDTGTIKEGAAPQAFPTV